MSAPYLPPVMSDVVVDLSHWEAPVDFAQAKDGGITSIFLKATQGSSYVDPVFVQRAMLAAAAGLNVGAYHFMDASDPLAQVRHFLSVAGHLAILAFDVERNGVSGGTVSMEQAAEAVSFFQSIRGYCPGIYIGRGGVDGRSTGLPNDVLSRCWLWLPEYGVSPICPPGWSNWKLWQHTDGSVGSDVVPVPGIGRCDRNRFAGTVAQLAAWWKSPASAE
jgi:lysozyme